MVATKFIYYTLSIYTIYASASAIHETSHSTHIKRNEQTQNSNNTLEKLWLPEWGEIPDDPIDFLTIFSYKFSLKNGEFSSSNFESLLSCTLSNDCPPLPDPPSAYSLLTDCEVNTGMTPVQCDLILKCASPSEILSLMNKSQNDTISLSQFRNLLPVLIYQSQSGVCSNVTVKDDTPVRSKPKPAEVWGYGILFVTLISGCSLAGVSVLPLMARDFYQKLLTCLVGLAVGSLAASSLFHLIPQAFKIIDTSGNGDHDYLFMSLGILSGIWGFFMIERIIKFSVTQHQKRNRSSFPPSISSQAIIKDNNYDVVSNGTTSNGDGSITQVNLCGKNGCNNYEKCPTNPKPSNHKTTNTCGSHDVKLIYESQEQAIKASFGHQERPDVEHTHNLDFVQGEDSVVKTVAWMIIFGDGFHNFIDGVSIGAAFSESILTGISISLAVMCEELPHELGDFAVLLNSGMTMKQAIMYNFLSALTCYVGLVVGILVGEFTQDTTLIFALAGGMFLYIALVDMLPEMNEIASKAAEISIKEAAKVLFLQNLGMMIGVLTLFFLAYYQDEIVIGE